MSPASRMTPSVSRKPIARSMSSPGVRMVTANGRRGPGPSARRPTRISSGSSPEIESIRRTTVPAERSIRTISRRSVTRPTPPSCPRTSPGAERYPANPSGPGVLRSTVLLGLASPERCAARSASRTPRWCGVGPGGQGLGWRGVGSGRRRLRALGASRGTVRTEGRPIAQVQDRLVTATAGRELGVCRGRGRAPQDARDLDVRTGMRAAGRPARDDRRRVRVVSSRRGQVWHSHLLAAFAVGS